MMITKRALLISNPGEPGAENYARGVYVDIKNYQQFLTSSEGGAWEQSEIRVLDRPSKMLLRLALLDLAIYDYTLVMFTGHGWYSSVDRDRILELRKGEEIASDELSSKGGKRLVIMDCCQVVIQESAIKAAQFSTLANERGLARTANRKACHDLYLKGINDAPMGTTRISSCAINEFSSDSADTGGYYSSSLILGGEDWARKEAQSSFGSTIFSIASAHEAAAEQTRRRSRGSQNPSIEKAKTGPYFPFAVFA